MEKAHTIHIRGLDDETYWKLRSLKRRYGARDWATLLRKLVEDIEEQIKGAEWI
jgi:hypothetical protein